MPDTYRFRDLASAGVIFSRVTIQNMVRAGTFPQHVKLMNRTIVWHRADVDAWLASRTARVPA
jgi:prophage regulatory protein